MGGRSRSLPESGRSTITGRGTITGTEATISAHTALGRFRVDGTLGRGGMAVVYLAYDTELRRPVAVKMLADHGLDDAAFRARFAREARSAAMLSHPNIVQVFDIGEDAGRPFIVMEYVEGGTLADVMRRERRLAPPRVAAIARQCCAGLVCAHDAGLVHRDIKPHNLLLTPEAAIKIADFGVARALDQTRLTLTGSIIGTARYLAPEQADGGAVTPAADIYALGVVMYELLTGRPPHPGDSLPELVAAKRAGNVRPPRTIRREIPAELDAAVMACLDVDPAARPTAETLALRLADAPSAVRPDETAAARTTVEARPARRVFQARRRPGRLAAAAAVLVAAAVLAVLAETGGSSPPPPHPVRTPSGHTPVEHAHNLAHWIRGHTG
ncbi:MAG TPA: serine/threonine-protein kinase [Gaiellales bacterium]|nr:serine/threonine-protein kinase [Gaiellales bacterium]